MVSSPPMDSLDFLARRRSVPARLLGEPGPAPDQLRALLEAAVRVPDHGRLAPWRFLRIQRPARQALGGLLPARRREREPAAAAAQAMGFGAQWLTGWAAYDPVVGARLGLAENERVLGFVHIGTATAEAPERPRPDPLQRLADWTP